MEEICECMLDKEAAEDRMKNLLDSLNERNIDGGYTIKTKFAIVSFVIVTGYLLKKYLF